MSREGALHKAVCEAVIHLNIGENFQASHILRDALVEYADHQAQQPAAAVPEGYALVPVEPTEAMLAAWLTSGEKAGGSSGGDTAPWMRALRCYRAMLAAAARKGE